MSTPIHPTKKFIPTTMTVDGAVEALRAVEPGVRWRVCGEAGDEIVGILGLYFITMRVCEGFWCAQLGLQCFDLFGFESSREVANTLSECALSAVEELSEHINHDAAYAA